MRNVNGQSPLYSAFHNCGSGESTSPDPQLWKEHGARTGLLVFRIEA